LRDAADPALEFVETDGALAELAQHKDATFVADQSKEIADPPAAFGCMGGTWFQESASLPGCGAWGDMNTPVSIRYHSRRSSTMLKIAIVIGSTRPGRRSEPVAQWVLKLAKQRKDAEFEILDPSAFNLPVLDEPMPPSMRQYTKDHTKAWSAAVSRFDAYVFITPEYNHGPAAALKNAIDFLYHEWVNKAAGFVSYGSTGGVRAVEQLRQVMAEIQIADVRGHVSLSLFTDFEKFTTFTPAAMHEPQLHVMLDQVVSWGTAMKGVRESAIAKAA